MKNEVILRKAIEKAEKGGLDLEKFGNKVSKDFECWFVAMKVGFDFRGWQDYNFIFHHDFAKTYWGGDNIDSYIIDVVNNDAKTEHIVYLTRWQYHLQIIVLEEDKLKYLEKFL